MLCKTCKKINRKHFNFNTFQPPPLNKWKHSTCFNHLLWAWWRLPSSSFPMLFPRRSSSCNALGFFRLIWTGGGNFIVTTMMVFNLGLGRWSAASTCRCWPFAPATSLPTCSSRHWDWPFGLRLLGLCGAHDRWLMTDDKWLYMAWAKTENTTTELTSFHGHLETETSIQTTNCSCLELEGCQLDSPWNHWIDQGGVDQVANIGKPQSSWLNSMPVALDAFIFPSRSQEVGDTDRWRKDLIKKAQKGLKNPMCNKGPSNQSGLISNPKAILGHLFQATSQQPSKRPSCTHARPTPSPPMSCDKRSRTKPASDGFQNKIYMMLTVANFDWQC